MLSQNTDFVIDFYDQIVNDFSTLSKNRGIEKSDEFGKELAELEKHIKEKILREYIDDSVPLILKENNQFIDDLHKNIDNNQGIVSKISDIVYISEGEPFKAIIEAIEKSQFL